MEEAVARKVEGFHRGFDHPSGPRCQHHPRPLSVISCREQARRASFTSATVVRRLLRAVAFIALCDVATGNVLTHATV